MIFKYKFCLWLIDTLSRSPMTLEDIQRKWLEAWVNPDGEFIADRTFNRYRNFAEALMDVTIECDKKCGNVYRVIKPIGYNGNNKSREWMLSAFRVSSFADRVGHYRDVMVEPAPPSVEWLEPVMEAIDKKHPIQMRYKSFFQEEKEFVLNPAFVRLFKQRWYVIGEVEETHKPITCAFERILDMDVMLKTKSKFSKTVKPIMCPDVFFEHCYGVIRQFEPIKITIRAFWPQNAYISSVPIHESQREVYHEPEDNYTDFELFVRPTYDLKQELLWHRDKLAVIAPESFRQDMIHVLKATLQGYETGENHAIDE